MKQTTIDPAMLPHVYLTWETKKGTFYLDCETGIKTEERPIMKNKYWKQIASVMHTAGAYPVHPYCKYHADIDMLEIATVTVNTQRKEEPHPWIYAGEKYFINKEKVVYDENGNTPYSFTFSKKYWFANFRNYLQQFGRGRYNPVVIDEFKKFLGSTYYTIGNGRTIDVQYLWHIQDWYEKKTATRTKGKAQKLVDKLIEMPLSDISNLRFEYPVTEIPSNWGSRYITGLIYFERLTDGWSVLRMLKRPADNSEINETQRIYLHDDGNTRITAPTRNGWAPAQQTYFYSADYQFANQSEAMEKCKRLKYLVTFFEDEVNKTYDPYRLTKALRFPEIEQFISLGYEKYAKRIANSSSTKADMKREFGYFNEKESSLLRKLGVSKHQLDKHMSRINDGNYWYAKGILSNMRKLFGEILTPLDNATFDKYYDVLMQIANNAYGFNSNIQCLNLDEKKVLKNIIRLREKHPNIATVFNDTMNMWLRLNRGTAPEIDWYFDSYSDLTRAHDAIYEIKRIQDAERRAMWDKSEAERLKKQEEKRIKIDEERKQYEYEDDNFIIRLPNNLNEIINEGSYQHICIGGYTARHAEGNTNLFFLRSKENPNTPFYAIEMNNANTIVQIHGKYNQWLGNNPEAIPTVIRWLRKNDIKCSKQILTCTSTGYGGTNNYVPMPVVD